MIFKLERIWRESSCYVNLRRNLQVLFTYCDLFHLQSVGCYHFSLAWGLRNDNLMKGDGIIRHLLMGFQVVVFQII